MKINPGIRSFGKEPLRNEGALGSSASSRPFSGFLREEREAVAQDELSRRMERIAQQGERLARSMTVRELREYKHMVQRFLEDTVRKGVGIKETRGWDRRGRTKRYQLLDEIDRTLISMADELLTTEQGRIELLGKVGEIRGLLINLFF
ncbi:YaaR family protein [Paenibacillus sp.]|uniref:YaaR family protein n=1 Tax=Paenibacillus sp. TaxID=58172 RepID=UPI002D68A38F|nr:YaaR family protein [Paenibacillus sp.]HZG87534.1 YaaR family protein [Paenibacillus sp.]